MVLRNRFCVIALDGKRSHEGYEALLQQVVDLYIDTLAIEGSLARDLLTNSAAYITFAITMGERVIAAITGSPLDRHQIAIQHLAVRAHKRLSGLGCYLVDLFRRYSLARHYTAITLLSVETAVGFYEKQGFVMTARTLGLMTLELESEP